MSRFWPTGVRSFRAALLAEDQRAAISLKLLAEIHHIEAESRSKLARCSKHARVVHPAKARRWDDHRKATQQRQRVKVKRQGAVATAMFELDARELIG